MLSDKPKLVFTDLSGKVTIVASLPCQQIKQQLKQTAEQQYLTALYLVGESKQ